MTQVYRVADLFAGVGGIRLGFDQAFGSMLKTVFVSDIDKFAAQVYTDNFGHDPEVSGDITKIKTESVPDFDICLAGFPCQAFSRMGKEKGFADPRGGLFQEVVRLCKEKKPKVIFCENVKALVSHNKGESFRTIKTAFEKIGYKVFYEVANSSQFGVPQGRERLYIVCFRSDIAPETFAVTGSERTALKGGIERILLPDSEVGKYVLSDKYMAFLERRREKNKAAGNGFGYKIREKGDIAGTLTCSDTSLDGNLIRYKDKLRKLAPRECARLQGFPDSFKLTLSDTQIYRLMGQTVSVPVIASIARSIKKVLGCSTEEVDVQAVKVQEPKAPTSKVDHVKVPEVSVQKTQQHIRRQNKRYSGCCCCRVQNNSQPLPLQCRACIAKFKRRMGL